MESNGMKFLAPFQGQDLTDIALHFKWTRRDGGDTEFVLEMADNERFADANVMEAAILEDAEVGYYFPKKDELPSCGGPWYARVREKSEDSWSGILEFVIETDHGRKPVKRTINAENPWFTIFDYSGHEPGQVWEMLPQEMKSYVGIGLIASYKAKAEDVAGYMLREDAKGYLWHLGALGPHETQFGKYCITSLCEIEHVMRHARNLVSVGFVEQYLGTQEESYWRNEYFFRLLALCAKYGFAFIYSDGNRNNLELAAMIKRPFFMDKMREYSDYFIFSYKQNHSHAAYSCFGAILGAWMDGACCEIGVQPENWYWNDAGFRDRPGECYGYLQGNEQQISACMSVEMLLTGLSIGAAHYSMEGESWLIECGKEGRLVWSDQGIAALSFFRAVLCHDLIPRKREVLDKIRMAVSYEGWSRQKLGDAWTGGILREVFEPLFHVRNGFELFPKESRFYYLPLVTDRTEAFDGLEILEADNADRESARKALRQNYPEEGLGNAYYVRFRDLLILMNSRENEEEAQWFSLPVEGGFLTRIQGAVSLWQYLIMKKEKGGYLFHVNTERGKNLRFCLYLSRKPAWLADSRLVEMDWNEEEGRLEIRVPGSAQPVEFAVADSVRAGMDDGIDNGVDSISCTIRNRQEDLPGPIPAVQNRKENPLPLLSDLPWSAQESADGCLPCQNACANRSCGRLPLLVDHLRYRHGISVGNHTRILWNLGGRYESLSFRYGFDTDAWLPRILDRDNIIWDRSEKRISMYLRLYGDGKELFRSPELTSTEGVHEGRAELKGIRQLELSVEGEVISEDPDLKVYLDVVNPVLIVS